MLPGIFIALMLRFDRYRKTEMTKGTGRGASSEKKEVKKASGFYAKYPYFSSTMFGYLLGLSMTIAVMNIFNAAQPALLYLVPTCVGATIFQGVVLGELSEL